MDKKRTVTRVGNVFCVEFEDFKIYFQFVAKDSTQMFTHVIRVFETQYPLDAEPPIEVIVNDKVTLWLHTMVNVGVSLGLWYKVGNASVNNIGIETVIFGVALKEKFINYRKSIEVDPLTNWKIWKINQPIDKIGVLPENYYDKVHLGMIYPPATIYKWIKLGYSIYACPAYNLIKRKPYPNTKSYIKKSDKNIESYYMFVGENLVKRLDLYNGKVTMIIDGEDPELPKFWATNWNYYDFIEEEEFNEAWNKYVL